jgi:dipeptidyl aminopeptidase/acylaminoacyl peptidase
VQFFVGRGFAVLDVDYRGSTGYGRAYRNALRGRWGVLDVFDCVDAVQALGDHRGATAITASQVGTYRHQRTPSRNR